jgi:hypothetical protein
VFMKTIPTLRQLAVSLALILAVPAGYADINFDYFPGPDGLCGTGDDKAVPTGTEIIDQYNSCGVTIKNAVASTGEAGLFAIPQGPVGSETNDIIPTTPPHAAAPMDIPQDFSTSSTGFVEITFFPSALDFSLDFIDVESSGTPGSQNTYIDVFLASSLTTPATRLFVPSGPTGNQTTMSYVAPPGDTVARIFVSLNDPVLGGESAAIDTLNFTPPAGCWLTSGGWLNAWTGKGKQTRYSFGGNVGPPPSGSWEHQDHVSGQNFHSNDAYIVECYNDGGAGPGNPKAKPNVALFAGTGRLKAAGGNWEDGFCFEAQVIDRGEPGRHDEYAIEVTDCSGTTFIKHSSAKLSGGNIQIHPPNPSLFK